MHVSCHGSLFRNIGCLSCILLGFFCAAPSGCLRVNMANIYIKQKNYLKAIKLYRMALDEISNAHKELRIKIMQNIGLVFVRMGQYSDAITSFEHIMTESPNVKTGFSLILCYYAVGDKEKMKKAFQKLDNTLGVCMGSQELNL